MVSNQKQKTNSMFLYLRNKTFFIMEKVINCIHDKQTNNPLSSKTQESSKTGLLGGSLNHQTTPTRNPETQEEVNEQQRAPLLRIHRAPNSPKVGLYNSSNYCYLNALIQGLFNVDIFKNAVLNYQIRREDHDDTNIMIVLKQIFNALNTKQLSHDSWYIDLKDTNIFEILEYSPDTQNDPREVLTTLLSKVEEIDSNISQQFEYTETKTNLKDNNVTQMKSNILITYPIDHNTKPHKTFTIASIVEADKQKSDFEDEEEIYPIALTALEFGQNILCISLSRTSKNMEKLLYKVKLNTTLTIDGVRYKLKSAVVHKGNNQHAGHYVIYTNENDGVYLCNDQTTTKVAFERNQAYMCFDGSDRNARTALVLYQREDNVVQPTRGRITETPQRMPNLRPRVITDGTQ